jgi:hypothetical protein
MKKIQLLKISPAQGAYRDFLLELKGGLSGTQQPIQKTLYALAIPSKSRKLIGRNLVRKTLKKYGKAMCKPRKKP